jgi:dephospho-CoA kinase
LSDDEPAIDDLDPPIDRTKLGALIFEDPSLRKKLNRITHPKIISKLIQKLSWGLFASGNDLCVADVPLLFEASVFLRMLFCVTICVTCAPEEEQLKRLQSRNPDLTKEECQQRMASQMPLDKKAKMADIVIDNSGDAAALAKRVEEVREELMMRLYGVGLTLFQIVAIMGISLPVAIYYKLYYGNGSGDTVADDGGLPDAVLSGEY